MKFHLTLVVVELKGCCVKGCVTLMKLGNLGQPFLILQKKTGQSHFAKGFLYCFTTKT